MTGFVKLYFLKLERKIRERRKNIMGQAKTLREWRKAERLQKRNDEIFKRVESLGEKGIRRSLFESLEGFSPKCGVWYEKV